MDKETASPLAPVAPVKTCLIEDVLSPSVIAMAKQAPTNEVVRSHVLASIKKPLPDTVKTFDEIKDWIEFNIVKPNRPSLFGDPPGRVTATVRRTHTEVGNCRYYDRRSSGECEYTLNDSDIEAAAAEAEDLESFFQEVLSLIRATAAEDPPETDSTGNIDYSDHESTEDTEVAYTVYHEERFREVVINYLRSHHPDLYNELA